MQTLSYFATLSFVDALKQFFADDLQLPFNALGDDPVRLADILPDSPAYTQNIEDVYAVGLVNDDAFSGNHSLFVETTLSPKRYDGIVILGVTLKTPKNALPKRGELAQIARAFNRAFHATPVMVVFKYQAGKSTFIALANTERGDYKQQWREGEKAGRVSLLRDIDIDQIHRGHAQILEDLKVPKTVTNFAALYEHWQKALDVSVLNKRFYSDLSNWFFAARQSAKFPDPAENATERGLIRLITRLIFTWFIKERGLVPEELFNQNQIRNLLIDTAPESDTYYRAVLQNLFFATLNTEMGTRRFRDEKRDAQNRNKDYGLHQYFRYKSTFTDADEWLALIKNVPFLNGGLFECLDPEDKEGQRIDGFSDEPKRQAHLPNKLFWGDDWEANLSDIYNSKKQQSAKVRPLLNLLHSYKFTIAENTPLEQDVALDPELLGKVFENLLASYNPETKTTARKQTGSFYTPREIVNYMVEEALFAHLVGARGGAPSQVDKPEGVPPHAPTRALLSDDDHQTAAELGFSDEEIQRLVHAINHCTILDPACGSGAFPMGALTKMVMLLNKLDPDNQIWLNFQLAAVDKALEATGADNSAIKEAKQNVRDAFSHNDPDYARKLYLIQNCLFGVDIQPIALQISKLRFFIALVIDQKIDDDKPNRGIRALPNLETKFVAANTLIALDAEQAMGNLFVQEELKALTNVRQKYFSASNRQAKKKIKEQDETLRGELLAALEQQGVEHKNAQQMANWNPYDIKQAAPFFEPQWMFGPGLKDGFNIVIGNPPYVQLQNDSGKLAEMFQDQKYETFARTGDIYCLFYEMGMKVLSQNGVLCFITSNKWMRAGYGEKLRNFFVQKTNPLCLIDFGGLQVFDSATVDTNILLTQKAPNKGKTLATVVDKNLSSQQELSVYLRQNVSPAEFKKDNSWVVLSPIAQRIKEKVERVGTPLKDWDIQINYGIKTGFNEAFIIDEAKRQELIEKDPKSDEIIRPILRGRDIKRYKADWKGLYLIATFPSLNLDIEKYPAVKQHLLSFGHTRLSQIGGKGSRKKTNNKWFETQDSISYWEDFLKPKLIYPNMTKYLPFVYDENGYCTNQKCFIATGTNIAFLVAFFNSSLFKFCFRDNFPELQGGTRELSKIFFDKIPVLPVSPDFNNEFKDIVEQIQDSQKDNANTKSLEQEIDNHIFDLYELTAEEREVIGFIEIQ